MTQLKKLDAAFRKAHDQEQRTSLAVSAVAIIDGAAPNHDRLKRLLAKRIQSIPRCTQVLRTEWIDYPDFNIARHVRRVALPRPGDDAELFRAIAHALERPLEPDRPLWECWVIEGLKDNRWAILMKIHHAMADGTSAAHLLTRLCDDADSNTFANHVGAKQVANHVSGSNDNPWSWADTLWQASAGKVVSAMESAVEAILPWARVTPTAQVTMRRYSSVRVPIAAVDKVCRKFDVTSNDVALAAITEGFRSVLLRRGERPRADSLRTLVPLLPYLPVEDADPVQRLRTVHNRFQAKPIDQSAGILESALNYLPTALLSPVIQLLARLPQHGIVTLATSMPGPRHQLRLMGRTLERVLPIPPTALQLSTGVAVLSYGDELVFGITADYDAAPDVKHLIAGIELGMARLVALSQDSVLLFTKERRGRSSRALPGGAPRGRASTPHARARR